MAVTDVEGKNGGVEDDDVTRPASRAPAVPDDGTAREANGSLAAGNRDGGGAAAPGQPATLRRLAPEESAGEVISLSTDECLLGRSRTCDVRLHSATASRRHAKIKERNGEWILSAVGGKTVIVDGRPASTEVRLRNAMKIQLGGDEFTFLQEDSSHDDSADEEETLVVPSAGEHVRSVPVRESHGVPTVWLAICAGAVLLAALAFWLLL